MGYWVYNLPENQKEVKLRTSYIKVALELDSRLCHIAPLRNRQLKATIHAKLRIYDRRTEKGIRQRDRIYFSHRRIIHEIRVNEKEHWHVDGLPSVESLFFEAKALDFAEVRSYLRWSNTVGCDPNDVFRALVCCRIKCERCLSRQDSDLSLLWNEFPGHYV